MSNKCEVLNRIFELYSDDSTIQSCSRKLHQLISEPDNTKLIDLYHEVIPVVEQHLSGAGYASAQLDLYHQLFRELEKLEASNDSDERFEFLIVIPVADRPRHLTSLMASLLDLCEAYNYGGFKDHRYTKISVLIADDSEHKVNIEENRAIAESYSSRGLLTHYFGLEEQRQQLDHLTDNEKDKLQTIIGDYRGSQFFHKGASLTRNITYLKLKEFAKEKDKLLFYFVDSDQEFKVNVKTPSGEKDVLAINYFYQLNQVFSNRDVAILTGKVVGDPPVSPAVMAGNFLDDVIKFLIEMTQRSASDTCQFHRQVNSIVDDACYHDMTELFGFKAKVDAFSYECDINEPHDHGRCFSVFIEKANHFFDGEHLTRRSIYAFENVMSGIKPARTVYTGNYIFKPAMLKYFIPFATLKLRMAGPVLGRLIRSDIAEQFVSANLPMLHKRTVQHIGQSEFRPGINRESEKVDLSGEFERQFFGDVMLFTIEQLVTLGYPEKILDKNSINEILCSIEDKLYQQYSNRQQRVADKLVLLKKVFSDRQNWWNNVPGYDTETVKFRHFISNMENNFGANAQGYQLINSMDNRNKRHNEILQAILEYADNRTAWEKRVS